MKSYHHIDSHFKYHLCYLNGNCDYNPPDHKSVALFGTLARAASKSTRELKVSVPIDHGGASGFTYTLKVANVFDDIVINNEFYIILVENCVLLTKTMFYVMPITIPTGLKPQMNSKILKMTMEHTSPTHSTGSTTLF